MHVLAVVQAARSLAGQVARGGGVERVNLAAVRDVLRELVEHTDRLTNYERQAVARGELDVNTGGQQVADILAAATHVLKADREQHEVLRMTDEEVGELFSVDEPPTKPEPEPSKGEDDELSAFDVD